MLQVLEIVGGANIELDDYTFSRLSSDPLTIKIKYKVMGGSSYSEEMSYTTYTTMNEYKTINVPLENIPSSLNGGSIIVQVSNSIGTSAQYTTNVEI